MYSMELELIKNIVCCTDEKNIIYVRFGWACILVEELCSILHLRGYLQMDYFAVIIFTNSKKKERKEMVFSGVRGESGQIGVNTTVGNN